MEIGSMDCRKGSDCGFTPTTLENCEEVEELKLYLDEECVKTLLRYQFIVVTWLRQENDNLQKRFLYKPRNSGNNSILVFHVVFLTNLYRTKKLTSDNAIFAGFDNDILCLNTSQIGQKCSKLWWTFHTFNSRNLGSGPATQVAGSQITHLLFPQPRLQLHNLG